MQPAMVVSVDGDAPVLRDGFGDLLLNMVYVFLIGNGSDHSAGHVNVKTSRQETSLFIEGSSAPDYRFFVPPLSVSVMSYHRISGLFRLLLQAVGGEEALLDSA